MSNAASSINVLTKRDQVMSPSSGFDCSLFANYALDGIKAALAVGHWQPMCSVGLICQFDFVPPGFSVVHVADDERHLGSATRQRGGLPLGLTGVPIGFGNFGPTAGLR